MNEELGQQLSDIAEYTGGFLVSFVQFILGVALFVGIIWVASWIGGKARRWFMRRTKSRWVSNPNGAALVENLLRLGTFAAGLVLALGVVGASTDSLVTWIGVIVAALSLALQDIIKNLVAGFYLLIEQPFKTGDRLIIGEQDGYVETVALRVTGLAQHQTSACAGPQLPRLLSGRDEPDGPRIALPGDQHLRDTGQPW